MSRLISPLSRHSASARGISLVELMVAMAIGLIVVGAVFTNYINNTASGRQTAAMTQITGDATLALGILRNHIAMAGYGSPKGVADKKIETNFSGPALLGCDKGFANIAAAADALSCNEAADSEAPEGEAKETPDFGHAIMVRYEADADSAPESATNVPGMGTVQRPTDCTGAGIQSAAPYIVDSRFQVDLTQTPPALDCRGQSSQVALVENIVAMRVHYGIGIPDTEGTGKLLRVVRYVPASDVQTDWGNVLSVRICVVARSTDEVLPTKTAYRDCDQNPVVPSDRRIYRAFTSTVLINNRLSSESLNPKP